MTFAMELQVRILMRKIRRPGLETRRVIMKSASGTAELQTDFDLVVKTLGTNGAKSSCFCKIYNTYFNLAGIKLWVSGKWRG